MSDLVMCFLAQVVSRCTGRTGKEAATCVQNPTCMMHVSHARIIITLWLGGLDVGRRIVFYGVADIS